VLGDDYILYPAGWHTLRPLGVAKWGTPVGCYKRQEGGDALGCALDSASCPTWEVRYKASCRVCVAVCGSAQSPTQTLLTVQPSAPARQ
jgi:hypothetical protein